MSEQDTSLAPIVPAGLPSPAQSAQEYSNFVKQVEIVTVFLQSARLENRVGPEAPNPANIAIQSKAGFVNLEGTIRLSHTYTVRMHAMDNPDSIHFELDVNFVVDYRSALAMTDAIFATFKDINLPLNTWPYFREYLGSTMARFNWVPYTLPVFVVAGTPNATTGRAPRRRKTQVAPPGSAS